VSDAPWVELVRSRQSCVPRNLHDLHKPFWPQQLVTRPIVMPHLTHSIMQSIKIKTLRISLGSVQSFSHILVWAERCLAVA
jgi:hypothetical protein